MERRKWLALLAGGALLLLSALAVGVRQARRVSIERKGVCLDYLAGLYDYCDRLIGRPFRELEVAAAGIKGDERVLDVGCGTGVLTLVEKEKVGKHGYVAGIDLGPKMITRARENAAEKGLKVDFRVASIDSVPFSRDTFDVVTSSLMVHHLPTEVKRAGFREVYRVLKPGGRYLIVDFPRAAGILGSVLLPVYRLFALLSVEFDYSLDLVEGKIPGMLEEAGFAEVRAAGAHRLVGILPVAFLLARKTG